MQGYGVLAFHPFGLSYYNLLVGGLAGADRLGLERTYWGDAVDPVLLDELARRVEPGQTAALAPTLHAMQPTAATTPALVEKGIILTPEQQIGQADWIVIYRRKAYWNREIRRNRPPPARRRPYPPGGLALRPLETAEGPSSEFSQTRIEIVRRFHTIRSEQIERSG